MKLNVVIKEGIRGSGFDTIIEDDGKTVDQASWNYGYNCSYDWSFARDDAPHVTDVLQRLVDRYHVEEVNLLPGKNMFKNCDVDEETVRHFGGAYCADLAGVTVNLPKTGFIPRRIWVAEDVCPHQLYEYQQDGGSLYMIENPQNNMTGISPNFSTDLDGAVLVRVSMDYIRQEVRIKDGHDPLLSEGIKQHLDNGGRLYAFGAPKNNVVMVATENGTLTNESTIQYMLIDDITFVDISMENQEFADAVADIPESGQGMEQ